MLHVYLNEHTRASLTRRNSACRPYLLNYWFIWLIVLFPLRSFKKCNLQLGLHLLKHDFPKLSLADKYCPLKVEILGPNTICTRTCCFRPFLTQGRHGTNLTQYQPFPVGSVICDCRLWLPHICRYCSPLWRAAYIVHLVTEILNVMHCGAALRCPS